MTRIVFSALVLALSTSAAAGTFTEDEATFAHLAAEDFQDQTPSWWTDHPADAPLVIGQVAYWGTVWADNGWCIPGMDSNSPCGGTNLYLASAVDLHMVPLEPTSQIGFRYGTQGGEWHTVVTLDDGTTEELHLQGTEPSPWGWGYAAIHGFIGYTADPGRTIVDVYSWGMDGGVDDVRVGLAGPETCDDLDAAILELGLDQGIERSLLAKVEAADRAEAREQVGTALNVLEALVSEIAAQTDSHLTADEADALLACIEARIEGL